MKTTRPILALLLTFAVCMAFLPIGSPRRCLTDFYCAELDSCSKYALHTEWSSDMLYLLNDSSYYYESQAEGRRGPLFSFGTYSLRDSCLVLKQNEEKTRVLISSYPSKRRALWEYTPFATLDVIEHRTGGKKLLSEMPPYFLLDNYRWYFKSDKLLEQQLLPSGYCKSKLFQLKRRNGAIAIGDTLLKPGTHVLNGTNYKIR